MPLCWYRYHLIRHAQLAQQTQSSCSPRMYRLNIFFSTNICIDTSANNIFSGKHSTLASQPATSVFHGFLWAAFSLLLYCELLETIAFKIPNNLVLRTCPYYCKVNSLWLTEWLIHNLPAQEHNTSGQSKPPRAYCKTSSPSFVIAEHVQKTTTTTKPVIFVHRICPQDIIIIIVRTVINYWTLNKSVPI